MSHLADYPDDWKPTARDDVDVRSTGDQRMLYDRKRDRIHVLNETAEFIWLRCDGKHTLGDLADGIRRCFDVPQRADVKADVERVIGAMLRKDLLMPIPGH